MHRSKGSNRRLRLLFLTVHLMGPLAAGIRFSWLWTSTATIGVVMLFLQWRHSVFNFQRHRPTCTPETPRLSRHRCGIRLPARVGGSYVDSLSGNPSAHLHPENEKHEKNRQSRPNGAATRYRHGLWVSSSEVPLDGYQQASGLRRNQISCVALAATLLTEPVNRS